MAEEKMEEKLSVEEAFVRLEEKLNALENPDLSLEDAFAAYQQGVELLKYCNDSIDAVEKKVQAISKEGELYEF